MSPFFSQENQTKNIYEATFGQGNQNHFLFQKQGEKEEKEKKMEMT